MGTLFGLIRHFWLVLKHVFAFYLAYFANFNIFDSLQSLFGLSGMATLAMIKSRQTNNNISAQKIFNHLTFWRRKNAIFRNFRKFYRNWAIKKSSKIFIFANFWRKINEWNLDIFEWKFANFDPKWIHNDLIWTLKLVQNWLREF